MATLSYEEVATHAKNAGFTGNNLWIAVAVAFAESSGNPRAHNSVNEGHFGLWQIAGVHHALMTKYNRNYYDPATNAKMAKEVYNGQGWAAWTTYTGGQYLRYAAKAKAAANKVGAGNSNVAVDPSTTLPDPLGINGFLNSAGEFVDSATVINNAVEFITNKQTWVRVTMFFAGGLLIMFAINRLANVGAMKDKVAKVALAFATKGATKGAEGAAKSAAKSKVTASPEGAQ